MGRIRDLAAAIYRFFRTVWSEFAADQCLPRASGLAFASLLALVPLSAVLFSLFSALGTFSELTEDLQSFLVRILLPTRQQEILEYVNRFVDNTRRLGVTGLLVFTATAVLLLAAIQRTFDGVWGSASRKNSLRRVVTYLSVLVVGSFLIAMGFNLTVALRRMVGAAIEEIQPAPLLLINVFPPVFVFIALFLMITLVPSARISYPSALIGSAVGALLWGGAQLVFVFWTNQVIRLSVVYGSLAAIPIFLIWLYVAWLIVLFGLEVTYVHQYRTHRRGVRRFSVYATPGASFLAGIHVYFTVAQAFHDGSTPPTIEEIAKSGGLGNREVRRFVEALRHERLIVATGSRLPRFVPGRSLESTTITRVLSTVYGTDSIPEEAMWPEEERGAGSPANVLHARVTAAALREIDELTVLDVIRKTKGQTEHA